SGEVLRRTAAQVRHTVVQSRDNEWLERGDARSLGAAGAGSGIAKRACPGIRSANRENGQGDLSRSGVAQTGERCRRSDCHDLCADDRGSATLPEEPRRRMFCWVTTKAKKLGR